MQQTNWIVLSGPPSSGKTTLINELEKLGYLVSQEVARQVLSDWISRQPDSKDMIAHALSIQREILALHLHRERAFKPEQLVFFDRGIPDSVAYFNFHGYDEHIPEAAAHYHRYRAVFFCAQLPVVPDGLRMEDDSIATRLGELIYNAYVDLGYQPIILPQVSVQARLQIILDYLKEQPWNPE